MGDAGNGGIYQINIIGFGNDTGSNGNVIGGVDGIQLNRGNNSGETKGENVLSGGNIVAVADFQGSTVVQRLLQLQNREIGAAALVHDRSVDKYVTLDHDTDLEFDPGVGRNAGAQLGTDLVLGDRMGDMIVRKNCLSAFGTADQKSGSDLGVTNLGTVYKDHLRDLKNTFSGFKDRFVLRMGGDCHDSENHAQ